MTAVPRHHDLAGLGGSRGDRAVERRDDTEIRSVGAGLFEQSARAASACAAAMSACACRICPSTATTWEERMAGFTRFAFVAVNAPRAAST